MLRPAASSLNGSVDGRWCSSAESSWAACGYRPSRTLDTVRNLEHNLLFFPSALVDGQEGRGFEFALGWFAEKIGAVCGLSEVMKRSFSLQEIHVRRRVLLGHLLDLDRRWLTKRIVGV